MQINIRLASGGRTFHESASEMKYRNMTIGGKIDIRRLLCGIRVNSEIIVGEAPVHGRFDRKTRMICRDFSIEYWSMTIICGEIVEWR